MGALLGHVHIPGRNVQSDEKETAEQLELGMGIHNEPGCRVLSPPPDLPTLVDMMLEQLLNPNDEDRAFVDIKNTDKPILLVNNLGAISVLELGGITRAVVVALG